MNNKLLHLNVLRSKQLTLSLEIDSFRLDKYSKSRTRSFFLKSKDVKSQTDVVFKADWMHSDTPGDDWSLQNVGDQAVTVGVPWKHLVRELIGYLM